MPWLKWQARLRGEKVLTHPQPDEEDEGYYRTLITEPGVNAKTGQRNGKTIPVMWGKPVAYFVIGGKLCGVIGNRDMTEDELVDLWTYVCRYPISEELYRDVAEAGKPWPDLPPKAVAEVPAADRDVAMTDNEAPQEPLDVQHATAIKAAIGAAPTGVKSLAEADVALGSKNRIAELRLAADKAGKAIYEPMYRTYTAEQKKWSPMIALATAKEKELNTAILMFRESERRRIAAEQAEAERKQREIDEANQRAADRAIIRGEPEEPPEVVEIAAPVAPVPVVATYGTRNLKEEVHFILDAITDYDAVYNYLKEEPKLKALLLELATAKVKAGLTVPGATSRKGLI
jgi:hypothetical protein